jgi:ABC-type uncharacterized transport system YnjBCD permease subunit
MTIPYPAQLGFQNDYRIARWRPLVQWLLAIPHLAIAWALNYLRNVLTLISLFTVLFTERIPRPIFNAIAMVYRYEWRAFSYAMFLHDDYPPFDFTTSAEDDGAEPHATLTIVYPEKLNRWKPLYKWILAIPHYFVVAALLVTSVVTFLVGFVAVLITGEYPHGIRDFLVKTYRYGVRVQAYVGLLTDEYPPFRLAA